jgi:tetratricopeptide (TPR) repeat protein
VRALLDDQRIATRASAAGSGMAQTPAAAFGEAIELVNTGRIDEAEALCRTELANRPGDVNVLGLLGAVLIKTHQFDEAETTLKETIRLAPTFAKPHQDIGHLLLERQRPEEAVEYLQKATTLDPGVALAFFNLGKALALLGRGKEADVAFEASFELDPVRKTLALAAEHQREGRMQEAERAYRSVLRSHPKNVDALRLLGRVAYAAGRLEEAERLFRRAIEQAPDFVGAIVDLARTLRETHHYEESIAWFRKAIALEPTNVQAHFQLGGVLSQAALNFEAIDEYKTALKLQPEYAAAFLSLGHALKTVGQQEEAISAYRECMRIKPDNGQIHWSLANLKTYRLTEDDIADMETRVGGTDLSDDSRVNFLFALAKAYEDSGDFDRSWDYYAEGNSTRRMLESYDPVRTEVTNDAIVEVFDAEFLDRNTGLGNPDDAPIFVLGLPRSGSTLLEQILASHSQVEGTSELPYLQQVANSLSRNRADGVNYPEAVRELSGEHFQALGGDYLELARLNRTEGTPYFVDKMPNNFPIVGFIHLIFPNAKIIDARRHPLDSCVSCYRQLFAKGQSFTYDLTDIGEYFLQYQRMMDHWHEVLPGRVLTVQHEDVVRDLDTQVRRILDYCELPFENACINYHETDRPIRTPSSEQVRRPVYTDSLGFWRHYETHIGELVEVLEPALERYQAYLG